MHRSLFAFFLFISIAAPHTIRAQAVGDTVELVASHSAGVPVHLTATDKGYVRWLDGTQGKIASIDNATGWCEVKAGFDTGWIAKKYLRVVDGGEATEEEGDEDLTYAVGTWNLEWFKSTKSRGFPENTAKGAKKGPTYPPRSATDIALVAKTISDHLQAAALVLNEVNGVSGKKQSNEMDQLVKALGPKWKYEIGLSGNAQRVVILYDEARVKKKACSEIAIAKQDVEKTDIFDRDPLMCHFALLDAAGVAKNDFVLVGVHLASGQHLVQNHNAAVAELSKQIAKTLTGALKNETDILIAGDINASAYDNNKEDFWDGFDATMKYVALAPKDGDDYPETRLAGVPLQPKSQIDYVFASSTKDGMTSTLAQSLAQVHHELLDPHDYDAFREHQSDHIPVTVRVRVTADDDN